MHGLGKTFGWSLHFSFRNTQIAVVVVAGVGMVTSLPPAAPAMPWLMLPCSIAGSSHGAPSCHTSPSGMSPALDPGSQPTKSPFLSATSGWMNHPQAELWEGQEWAQCKGSSQQHLWTALPGEFQNGSQRCWAPISLLSATYNSLDEMPAAWEKGKRTKPDQISQCHYLSPASHCFQ